MTPAKMNGRRFGRLVVTSYVSPRGQIHRFFLVLCKCGTRAVVRGNCLRSGHSQSCGCLVSKTRHTTHGNLSPESPEYETWKEIMLRCHNPRDVRFQHYGGRGIKVCVRWRRSFAAFFADMGRRPSPKHLIARLITRRAFHHAARRRGADCHGVLYCFYKLKFQKNRSFARRFLRATWPLASDQGRHLPQR